MQSDDKLIGASSSYSVTSGYNTGSSLATSETHSNRFKKENLTHIGYGNGRDNGRENGRDNGRENGRENVRETGRENTRLSSSHSQNPYSNFGSSGGNSGSCAYKSSTGKK